VNARGPILVVDDHPLNLKLVRVLLEAEGYLVRTATNAEEARRSLAEERPALLLMDIQLPDLDGLALTRSLKADPATFDLPIVAVTAYAMKGDAEKMRAAGCNAYVPKPIDTRALLTLVSRFLPTAAKGAQP
jgi:two-component system, cell cycle response regulator DivK